MDTTLGTDRFRIGILLPVADLYHRLWDDIDEALERLGNGVAERFRSAGLDAICSPVVSLTGQVEAACDEFVDKDVDLLLVALAPYCPSGVLAPALVKVPLPVLLWPMQEILRLDPQTYDAETVKLNHGVHGIQDLANVLGKTGRSFGVLHGHHEQTQFLTSLKDWAQAGRIVQSMRNACPVQVGGYFENMLDLQVGEDDFLRRLGITVTEVSTAELTESIAKVTPADVAERVTLYREGFELGPDVGDRLLAKTARGEMALRAILSHTAGQACGLNFLQLCNDERVADGLHVAASMLMHEGLGYAAEGDWVTAVLVRGMQQGFGVASFSEIFSVDYEGSRLLLKHWGEGNFALARAKPRLLASRFTDRCTAEFTIVDFEFTPGPATLVNLNSTADGIGQLVSVEGEMTNDHLPKIDGPRGLFRPTGGDVTERLTEYAYAGASHHLALVPGVPVDVLDKVCRLVGWSYQRF